MSVTAAEILLEHSTYLENLKPIKSDYFYVQRMKPCLLKKKHPLFQPILKRETPQKLCVSSVMGV